MSQFETDVQRALGEFHPVVACHKDDIFGAATAGMTVACSATVRGQLEPLQGVLKYAAGPPETLSGVLTQWQQYGPGSPGPFAGAEVRVGAVAIQRGSNDVNLSWQSKERSLDSWCLNTILGGTDSEGDVWTIAVTAYRIY